MTRDLLPGELVGIVAEVYRLTRLEMARADLDEATEERLLDGAEVLETVLRAEGIDPSVLGLAKPASPRTLEEFWRYVHGPAPRWRVARKGPFRCEYCGRQSITAGDRYLDTGEVVGQWRTAKLCARHAVMTEVEAAADKAAAEGVAKPASPR